MQRFERLSRRHHREGFDCGNPELNDYLRHTARQHTDKGLSRTDVLVDDEAPTEVLGYVTVCLAEIITDSLPLQYGKKYPAKAHGVKLARLAIAKVQATSRPRGLDDDSCHAQSLTDRR